MSSETQATQGLTARQIGVACARLAAERMAREVKLIEVGDRLGIADFFVLATVNNSRQARAVRDAVRVGLKALGVGVPNLASEDPDGRWSLFDYATVVLHMFDDEGRSYYDLDGMWADAPQVDWENEPPTPKPAAAPGDPEADESQDTDHT
ncbi:MAG: hypothetical protein DHS20C15_11160 [Planctomycetota bacterium]|nr:MAG: hypothetical protein DHS20C15_11160 [Planctomycetota bacterium]